MTDSTHNSKKQADMTQIPMNESEISNHLTNGVQHNAGQTLATKNNFESTGNGNDALSGIQPSPSRTNGLQPEGTERQMSSNGRDEGEPSASLCNTSLILFQTQQFDL